MKQIVFFSMCKAVKVSTSRSFTASVWGVLTFWYLTRSHCNSWQAKCNNKGLSNSLIHPQYFSNNCYLNGLWKVRVKVVDSSWGRSLSFVPVWKSLYPNNLSTVTEDWFSIFLYRNWEVISLSKYAVFIFLACVRLLMWSVTEQQSRAMKISVFCVLLFHRPF